jgi:hypothetical protein
MNCTYDETMKSGDRNLIKAPEMPNTLRKTMTKLAADEVRLSICS